MSEEAVKSFLLCCNWYANPPTAQGHVIDSLARDFYFRQATNVRACAAKLSRTAAENEQNVGPRPLRVRGKTVDLDGAQGVLLRLPNGWTFTAVLGKDRERRRWLEGLIDGLLCGVYMWQSSIA
jgi:hypothetical protein